MDSSYVYLVVLVLMVSGGLVARLTTRLYAMVAGTLLMTIPLFLLKGYPFAAWHAANTFLLVVISALILSGTQKVLRNNLNTGTSFIEHINHAMPRYVLTVIALLCVLATPLKLIIGVFLWLVVLVILFRVTYKPIVVVTLGILVALIVTVFFDRLKLARELLAQILYFLVTILVIAQWRHGEYNNHDRKVKASD